MVTVCLFLTRGEVLHLRGHGEEMVAGARCFRGVLHPERYGSAELPAEPGVFLEAPARARGLSADRHLCSKAILPRRVWTWCTASTFSPKRVVKWSRRAGAGGWCWEKLGGISKMGDEASNDVEVAAPTGSLSFVPTGDRAGD